MTIAGDTGFLSNDFTGAGSSSSGDSVTFRVPYADFNNVRDDISLTGDDKVPYANAAGVRSDILLVTA